VKARQAHQELYSERNTKTSENENGGVEGDDGEDPQRQKKLLLPRPHVSACVGWFAGPGHITLPWLDSFVYSHTKSMWHITSDRCPINHTVKA